MSARRTELVLHSGWLPLLTVYEKIAMAICARVWKRCHSNCAQSQRRYRRRTAISSRRRNFSWRRGQHVTAAPEYGPRSFPSVLEIPRAHNKDKIHRNFYESTCHSACHIRTIFADSPLHVNIRYSSLYSQPRSCSHSCIRPSISCAIDPPSH